MDKGQYSVYIHIFPNGKTYVGVSKNCKQRWSNGNGYKSNTEMMNAINEYGWQNIEHKIIAEHLTYKEAGKVEQDMISKYDSINNGYNKSKGGALGKNYYSTNVNHMLDACRDIGKMHPLMSEYAEEFRSLADNEDFAISVNFIDLLIRGLDGYESLRKGDQLRHCTEWLCILKDEICTSNVLNGLERFGDYTSMIIHKTLSEMRASET